MPEDHQAPKRIVLRLSHRRGTLWSRLLLGGAIAVGMAILLGTMGILLLNFFGDEIVSGSRSDIPLRRHLYYSSPWHLILILPAIVGVSTLPGLLAKWCRLGWVIESILLLASVIAATGITYAGARQVVVPWDRIIVITIAGFAIATAVIGVEEVWRRGH